MRENRKHITRVSRDEARQLEDETDYSRLDAMTDADITKAAADDPDAPPLDLDWTQARLTLPPRKDVVTLRLDRDVLDWFRTQGKGYQTRINQVLRAFYEARRDRFAPDVVEVVKGVKADATAALARDHLAKPLSKAETHAMPATLRGELAASLERELAAAAALAKPTRKGVAEGVKASGRGSIASVGQAAREAWVGAKEQRQASVKKAHAAKKRRAAKQAASATVAKRRA